MAEIAFRLRQQFNTKPRQLRVDGTVFQLPKKHAKRLAEWADETWAAGKRFQVSQLEADSRTLIEVGCFHPVCSAGSEPVPIVPWQDLALEKAAAALQAPPLVAFEENATIIVQAPVLTVEDKKAIGTIRRYGVAADVIIMVGGLGEALDNGDVRQAKSFLAKAKGSLDEVIGVARGGGLR